MDFSVLGIEMSLGLFLACSYIYREFEPGCSYSYVLIKKSVDQHTELWLYLSVIIIRYVLLVH